jgi:ubiquinone/menaquinone biosynthesis C-methylase UbiE
MAESPASDTQIAAFEQAYAAPPERFAFHDTASEAVRYSRDRRLRIALDRLQQVTGESLEGFSSLVVCGGAGGEGSYLANRGIRDVTVSDFSPKALAHCEARDPRLATRVLDAEALDLEDESYELVLVQDGLHHLSRPTLGLTEMLRVARRAVIVIEPHAGLVARMLGREWERIGDAVNYVFRWDERLLVQTVRSYLLERPCAVEDHRLWDYPMLLPLLTRRVGGQARASALQQAIYRVLNATSGSRALGNMMVGVIVKDPQPARHEAPARALFR